MTIKARLINSTFIPSLTYQCQTWTLNKAQKQKITTEKKCLRGLQEKPSEIKGSRPRGRPRKLWINEVADHLHENNTTITQAMHQALARQPLLPATPIR
jgi:hypothetical protein